MRRYVKPALRTLHMQAEAPMLGSLSMGNGLTACDKYDAEGSKQQYSKHAESGYNHSIWDAMKE